MNIANDLLHFVEANPNNLHFMKTLAQATY